MLTAALLAAAAQATLAEDLDRMLLDPALLRASAGILVKQFDGPVLFDSGANKRFIPASVLKTVTVSACLENLGPARPFETRFWRAGNAVFLVGGWDPDLSISDLEQIRSRLNVDKDDRLFFWDAADDDDPTNTGWQRGDTANEDAAPVTALTVNRGSVEIWLRGGQLRLEPRNFGMTVKRESGVGELRVRRNDGSWIVHVWGKLPIEDSRLGTVSLPDPGLCAARIVCANATRKKLVVPGNVLSFAPRKLQDVARTTLVDSNNHFADTLLRMLGAAKGKSSAWEDSLDVVRSTLGKMGISQESMRLADGSGLSRWNEISPRTVVTLIEWMLRSSNGELFSKLLPAPGEGTLKTRLAGLPLRAKTGTMTGVSGLAGFIEIPPKTTSVLDKIIVQSQSRRFIFCIFFNHYPAKADVVRAIQDDMVRRIAKGE